VHVSLVFLRLRRQKTKETHPNLSRDEKIVRTRVALIVLHNRLFQ
jgi:hypothetical protein